MNTVLRPNIATLAEFAGLERAIVGNTIASGNPISKESMNKIRRYRSLVEQSLGQVLLLKGLLTTPEKMERSIEAFEKEFLLSFQGLREKTFEASKKQENDINKTILQVIKRKEAFHSYLFGITSELMNMSANKHVVALADALQDKKKTDLPELLTSLEILFSSFSQIKKVFIQIRYLDSSGKERVRVGFDGKEVKIIRGEQLQNKSQRTYYSKTVNMQRGEIYVSPLDLNIEFGKIEVPFKPVLRYATPVFAGEKQAGIIIFNLIANTPLFLHKTIEGEKNANDYILINKDGFYLHHHDETKEWGMMDTLERKHLNVKKDYPEAVKDIFSGEQGVFKLISGETLVYDPVFPRPYLGKEDFCVIIKTVKSVNYPVSATSWFDAATKAINSALAISNIAGIQANEAADRKIAEAKEKTVLNIILVLFVLAVFYFTYWWVKDRIFKPIQKLSDMTKDISGGDFSKKVVITTKNEIGDLARSFNKMTDDLQRSSGEIIAAKEKITEYANEMEQLAEKKSKQLVHADRLTTVGLLSTGVAHEIINPTSFISNNLQIFEKLWNDSIKGHLDKARENSADKDLSFALDEMPRMLKEMREGTLRISKIIRRLCDFSRIEEAVFEEASIGECINNAITFSKFNLSMKHNVDVQVNVPSSIPNIIMSKSDIEQVFINLFLNATHAMEEIKDDRKPTLKVSANYANNKVIVEVSDNACGIDEKHLKNIFDPFFTTKDVGKGTGLGLPISASIIEKHMGTIKASSKEGEGTTFTITLPCNPRKEKENRTRDSSILDTVTKAQSLSIEQKENHEVFEYLLKSVLDLTESEYGFIGQIFYDEKNPKGFLEINAWTNISWNDKTMALYEKYKIGGIEFRNIETLYGAVITSGKSVFSNNPSTDSRSGGLPEGHPPLNAFMGTPFYRDNELIGMMGIANRIGGYDEKLEERLQPFIQTCATIIAAVQRNKKQI